MSSMSDGTEDVFLSPEGVARIARLARLRIDPGDLGRWGEQMERIVEHVRKLREIPESELPQPSSPPETTLRLDEAEAGTGREELLTNAASVAHGLVPVPRVVDSGR
jgi:aspartyl-tRNA(Asn)/glutamyl-tRNA(Gln) amidotransferase subunit C